MEQTETQMRDEQESYRRTKKYKTAIAGNPAMALVYSVMFKQGTKFKGKGLWLINDDTLYQISCMASSKNYDKYDKLFEKMISSFNPPAYPRHFPAEQVRSGWAKYLTGWRIWLIISAVIFVLNYIRSMVAKRKKLNET